MEPSAGGPKTMFEKKGDKLLPWPKFARRMALSFALTLALGPLTIAIAWFAVRPLMSIGILAAGLIAAFLVARLRSSRGSGLAPNPPKPR